MTTSAHQSRKGARNYRACNASWRTWSRSVVDPDQPTVCRAVYHDVLELIAAIEHYIARYNQPAQPFVRTKTADEVIAKTAKQHPTSGTLR